MNKRLFSLAIFAFALGLFAEKTNAQASGTNPQLFMYRHNGSLGGSPAPAATGNTIGTLQWRALTAIGSVLEGATIRSEATNVSPGQLSANMTFNTSSFGIGLREKMIITPEGLVGIGLHTPLFHLDVVGNTHTSGNFWGRIHFDNNPLDDAPNTYFNEAYFERKMRSVLAVPAVVGANNFGGTLSLSPGGGAYDHQLFFGQEGIWNRREIDGAAAWSAAWEKLLTSGDINGRPNLAARFLPPNSPSSMLGDGQVFDNGSNVVIGGIPAGPTPVPVFAASDKLTVHGNTQLDGSANVTGNATVTGSTTTGTLSVTTNASVGGNATVTGSTTTGSLLVNTNATVTGNGRVDGVLRVGNPTMPIGSHKLAVFGSAIAEEVVVKLHANWPDYVLAENYDLKPLSEVEAFIQKENHLPGVPSAAEVAENGLSLGSMQTVQMEKIEEIYLHMIALEKRVNALETENKQLQVENAALKSSLGKD